MTRSWRAEPLGQTGVALKAPTFKDHQAQQKPHWRPKREVAEEVLIAEAIVSAIEDEGLRVPQGRRYTMWRYAQGLAVETPSGWTVYVALSGQVLSRRDQEGRSFEASHEDPD